MASIFSLFGTIFIDNEKANKSIDETTQKADKSGKKMATSFSSVIGTVGKVGAAVTGAAAAIGTGLFAMASNTASAADAVDKGSQKVGFSAEAYQKWGYVLAQNGDSVDSLTTYVTKLTNNLDDAKNGSEQAAAKFARLGLSVDDLAGMSREDAFDAVIKALAGMTDESERAAIANDLLGNKSAALAAMLNTGGEAIDDLKQRASDLGMVMSDEAVKQGVNFGDMVDDIKRSLGGALNTIVSAMMPVINNLLDNIIKLLPSINATITRLAPLITDVADAVMPLLMDLIDTLLPPLMELLEQIMPILTTIIKAVLPVVVKILQMALPIIMKIVNTVLPLALKLINAILPLFDTLMPILEVVFRVIDALLTPLLTLLTDILTPIIDLLAPIIELINALLAPLLEIVNSVLGNLEGGLFGALNPLQMFSPILQDLSGVITGVFGNAVNIIVSAINTLKNIFSNIIDFIKNVFAGNWSAAWDNVKNIFANIWNYIKDIGKNAINGLITVFETGLNGIINFINKITDGLSKVWEWAGIPGIPDIPKVNIPRLTIGMDYVPYDDFPALLHKGERVLRAGENKAYTEAERQRKAGEAAADAESGSTVNITVHIENFNGTKADADDLAESLGGKLLELLQEALDRKEKAF